MQQQHRGELPLVAALAGGAAFGAALALAGVAVARMGVGGGPSSSTARVTASKQQAGDGTWDAMLLRGQGRSGGTATTRPPSSSWGAGTPEPQREQDDVGNGSGGVCDDAPASSQQQQPGGDALCSKEQDRHATPQRARARSRGGGGGGGGDDDGAAEYDQLLPPAPAANHAASILGPCFSMVSPVNAKKRSDPFDARPRENYLSWDDYFMAVAFLSAQRSKDPNKQVGAVIVGPDAVILSIGYNGFPRGCPDGALPWAKRSRGGGPLATKYPYVVHAEANALLNKNHASVAGAKVYVTMFPCNECAKLLIQAGVREVVYHEAKAGAAGAAEGPAGGVRGGGGSSSGCGSGSGGSGCGSGCGSDGHGCGGGGGGGGAADDGDGSGEFPGFPAPGGGGGGSGNGSECRGGGGGGDEGWGAAAGAAGGGALDAGYVASRRLLTMAGVALRQHRLKAMIVVNPATD